MSERQPTRDCLREPIPELIDAARFLDAAVSAHYNEHFALAGELIAAANLSSVRAWTESLWGKNSPYVRPRSCAGAPPSLPESERSKDRNPSASAKRALIDRDGFQCRFCGIPVIRTEVRQVMRELYPDALPWGDTNDTQHAAFQALWLQYDHLIPHSRGGSTDLSNLVITCAPCNYGRGSYTVEEVGLNNPLLREPIGSGPVGSGWDGLERFLGYAKKSTPPRD